MGRPRKNKGIRSNIQESITQEQMEIARYFIEVLFSFKELSFVLLGEKYDTKKYEHCLEFNMGIMPMLLIYTNDIREGIEFNKVPQYLERMSKLKF